MMNRPDVYADPSDRVVKVPVVKKGSKDDSYEYEYVTDPRYVNNKHYRYPKNYVGYPGYNGIHPGLYNYGNPNYMGVGNFYGAGYPNGYPLNGVYPNGYMDLR